MKNIVAISLVVILLGTYSCSKLTTITFYEQYNQSVTIPQLTGPASADTVSSPLIATGIASDLQANNTSSSLVQSVKLQTATLTITAPSGQTFGFLQNVRAFIFTDSLPAVEIANDYNIPSNADTLNLNIDAVQLKPYLLSNNFGMRFITVSNAATTNSMTLKAYLKFQIQANLLGL